MKTAAYHEQTNEYRAGLIHFLDVEKQRVQWVPFSRVTFYLRKGKRYFANHTVAALDFANFALDEMPPIEGAWEVLQFVEAAERICNERRLVFYVECVMNEAIAAFFKRRKYKEIYPAPGAPPNFVKYPRGCE